MLMKLYNFEIDVCRNNLTGMNCDIKPKENMHWYYTSYTRSPYSPVNKSYSIYILLRNEIGDSFNKELWECVKATFDDYRGYDAIHDKLRPIFKDDYQMFFTWTISEAVESIRE